MKSNIKSRIFIVAVLFFTAITLQSARAETPPLPDPGFSGDNLSQCFFSFDSSNNFVNSFKSGSTQHKITYKRKVMYKVGENIEAFAGRAGLYQIQPSSEFGSHDKYYIKLDTGNNVLRDNTGHSETDIPFTPTIMYSAFNRSDISGQSADSYDTDTSTGRKIIWVGLSDINNYGNDPFGKYLRWISRYGGLGGAGSCLFTSKPTDPNAKYFKPINTSKNGNTYTVALDEIENAISKDRWYYVAHGNYNDELTGYIYRSSKNSNNYIMAGVYSSSGTQRLLGSFTENDSSDWKLYNASEFPLENFQSPGKTERIIVIKPVDLDFEEASKNFGATIEERKQNLSTGREITIEIQLNSAKGPFTNKEHITMNVDRTHSEAGKGIDNDIYIVSREELEKIYNTSATGEINKHANSLVEQIVVCTHKEVPNFSTLTAFAQLKVLNPTDKNMIFSGSDIKVISGNLWGYKASPSPLVIKMEAKSVQSCGTSEDKDLVERGTDIAKKFIPSMGDLILQALQYVATIIQNFIVYIVSWAIGLASQSVPI